MNAQAAPAARWQRESLAELVVMLRAAGFPVGASETIDATQLLLCLSKREPALEDPRRLCSYLRPVFCKSQEQQQRFDELFDAWWRTLRQTFEPPPQPAPAEPAVPRPAMRGKSSPAGWIGAFIVIALVVAALWYFGYVDRTSSVTPQPSLPTPAPSGNVGSPQPAPPTRLAIDAPIDRYARAFRHNVELRPQWIWMLGVLPLAALLGVTLPALVLSRTRLRRRSEPMFLDPAPLEVDARRLVPKMPLTVSDRLARHVRSYGVDIERIARRPVIDLRRTIEATLRNRGVPTLRYSVARIHPAYLLLVDVANERDPRGRLFFQWAQRMQREGLDVEILLLRREAKRVEEAKGEHAAKVGGAAKPDAYAKLDEEEKLLVCPAEAQQRGKPNWTRLADLRAPRFAERLVVVSDGDPLVDEQGAWRREALRARLQRWRDRALFTPVEPRDWDVREQSIERTEGMSDPGFIVLPLEESALGAWTDLVLTGELSPIALSDPQRFPALLRHGNARKFTGDAPDPAILERLIVQLRIYLGDEAFYWFAAIAVTPIVRWELTLLLGKAMLSRLPGLASERSLNDALARNYRRLVRLPWLQREVMPEWLRVRLLLELSRERQAEVREVVQKLLTNVSPRAVRDGIELEFERPPGSQVDRRAPPATALTKRDGDPLYLGYMSGVSPDQLVLRAPEGWASWANKLDLPRRAGVRGWLERIGQRLRSEWARWAWAGGLPYLGLNQRRAVMLGALLLPVVVALGAATVSRPKPPVPAGNSFYEDVARPLEIGAKPAPELTPTFALSPDGDTLVALAPEGILASGGVQFTDLRTGEPIRPPIPSRWLDSLAFSPDGRLVAGASDHAITLWNARTGEEVGRLPNEGLGFTSFLAFAPDSRRMVVAGKTGGFRLWDVASRQLLRETKSGTTTVVAFSPDGRVIAAAGINGVYLRDAASLEVIRKPPEKGGAGVVLSIAFSPDGRRVVSGGAGSVRIWDATAPDSLALIRERTGVGSALSTVSFSKDKDGRRIVASGYDSIRLLDAETLDDVGVPVPTRDSSALIALSADGLRIVEQTRQGKLRVWTAQSGAPIGAPLKSERGVVTRMAFSADGRQVITGRRDGASGALDTWNASTGVLDAARFPLEKTGSFDVMAISGDGRAVVAEGAALRLMFNDANPILLGELPVSPGVAADNSIPGAAAFSEDGRLVALGDRTGRLRVWDAKGTPIHGGEFQGSRYPITALALSPNGAQVAMSDGNDIVVRNVLETQTMKRLSGHTTQVVALAFSRDNRRIAAAAQDRTLRIWDALTGQAIAGPLAGHTGTITGLAFTDGDRLASASVDGTLRLWDAEKGTLIGVPLHGSGPIDSIALSGDDRYIAVAARPGSGETSSRTSAGRKAPSENVAQQAPAPTAKGGGFAEPDNSVVQIWRIDPAAVRAPTFDATALQRLVLDVVARTQGWQPLYWLLGLAFLAYAFGAVAADFRVERILEQRGIKKS